MKIITSHKNPDFDAFASCVAARKLYPDHEIVLSGTPSKNLSQYLGIYKEYFTFKKASEVEGEIRSLVVVDTSSRSRLDEKIAAVLDEVEKIVIYDHHPALRIHDIPGEFRGRECGACVTLLLEEIIKRNMKMDPVEATLFLMAIHEDTGNFLYSSTTSADMEMAKLLLERGANLEEISDFVHIDMTPDQRAIFEQLMDNTRVIVVNSTPVAIAMAESEKFVGGLNVVIGKMWELTGHDTLIGVIHLGKKSFIIGRTRSDDVDLAAVMKEMGGGGHHKAASAKLEERDLEKVLKRLVTVLQKHIKPSLKARDIMSSPVRTVFASTRISEVNDIMERTGHNGLPVVEGDRLIGIVVKSDVDKAMKHGLGDRPVKSIATTKLITVDVDTPVSKVISLMRDKGIGRVPVLENGILVGIITRTDIIRSRHIPKAIEKRLVSWDEPKEYDVSYVMERLPKRLLNLLILLGNVGERLGMPTYIVGGFVRDLLLERENYDVDLVVEGNALEFAKALKKHFNVKIVEHPEFNTAAVFFKDGSRIDIATARTEYYERKAELPKIELSTIKKDLSRRDFSINAMAIKLNPGSFGRLLDFFNCREDLERGIVRVLYNLSFVEDPTRIVRAVRFETRFNFRIEERTLELMKDALNNHLLEKVTGARLREEVEKILEEKNVVKAIKRMGELDIILHLFPTVYYTDVMHRKVVSLFEFLPWLEEFSSRSVRRFYALLMVLMEYSHKAAWDYVVKRYGVAKRVLKEFNMVKGKLKDILDLIESEAPFSQLHPHLKDLMPETVAFIAAHMDSEGLSYLKMYLRKQKSTRLKTVNGEYLKRLGIPEGPKIREILDKLYCAKLDDKVADDEEELFLRKILHL